jgi:4-hydroxy-tetrahydrodipicolinate synthase
MPDIDPLRKISGFIADFATPFDNDDRIDWPAFEMSCECQIRSGARAIVVGETMGEASTLSHHERAELIGQAARIARGRIAVIAGAGSNSTDRAIELSVMAEAEGADAVLSVVPYYNKPMQAGLLAHFQAIAASTALPVLLHDNPSRTARELSDDTILRLSQSPQFIGLNDATASVARLFRLRAALPPAFRLLCGDDVNAVAWLASGGDGCISAVANIFPNLCRRVHQGAAEGDLMAYGHLSARFAAFAAAISGDAPVAALKCAMSLSGFMKPRVRLPLVELGEDAQRAVARAMASVTQPARTPRASSEGMLRSKTL